ncbi:DUF2267 domain-containing protein [Phyllobacterium sp. 21LDTY02-6]|jgi:hypothetical protein|uniref:DUF2267 domain-containing protein n=1 Tax=unclassified Phyllobacterium TaxID=2638441 RepID=UPI0020213915|nr:MULTISPECIES: DUF2267 domain-containing protein [unclassified Phyllobacterium]MCO4318394.1 DUF2267 domain-containing protein [Phyllobacterium sp. 21LDTY02-6]MCX8281314.1 DUF2267 domain-containing protein [Phyllobacterium sp. 0TCS1.6C]MCX8296030.1 DUF2267 domain-containing protein [Phyllobacterium sp. 0TCS1.6A]
MEELIARITANVGTSPDTARKAVGLILAFLQKEAPADKVDQLIAGVPGSEAAIAEAKGSGGFLSGMMPGVMGLGSQLMGMGLGMGEISGISKETIAFAREKAGDGPVDEVVNSIPGLSQFV